MKISQNFLWLVLLTYLFTTGCTTVPLPKYAKRGDFVTIPLGGTKTVANSNYLKPSDLAVTVVDHQGQVFPVNINILFRVYAEPSSRYSLVSMDANSGLISNGIAYANEGQWMMQFVMPETNSLGQIPAAGPAHISVASTEVNPDPDPKKRVINTEPRQLNEDLSSLPFEILEGAGGTITSEYYGMQQLVTGATILTTPDDELALLNNVGGAVIVYEYNTDSFIDAGLPYAVKNSPDQHIQLATKRKDMGNGKTQLTAILINPYGFYDDASWVPGTSYYDGLYVSLSWDTGAYQGNDIVDDSNWQSHISLVPEKSYYIDLDGNEIPNVSSVLSKVR